MRPVAYEPVSGLSGDWTQAQDVRALGELLHSRKDCCYYLLNTMHAEGGGVLG